MQETHFYNFRSTAIVLDDHKLFADSFALTLEKTSLFEKVIAYTKEEDLVQFLVKYRAVKKPFLFLDYYLEASQVTSILNNIRKLRTDAYIIIVSCISNPMMVKQLQEFQPDGIISKSDGVNEILDCIYALNKKAKYVSPYIQSIIDTLPDPAGNMPLTQREVEILRYFAQGHTVDATAELMNLSRHTVAAHRRKMFEKVNVHNISGLLAYARNIELI
ncbi:Positive transcription regulator EvgA [compost metagenome]